MGEDLYNLQKTDLVDCAKVLWEEFSVLHPSAAIDEPRTLAGLYEQIKELPELRSAPCLSGGGIRSASLVVRNLGKLWTPRIRGGH